MSFDPHKNFAYSTVATAPSPAGSGTSLTLQTGDGALFPDPSTDGAFNLTVWPAGVAPLKSNAEIVRCTARASDVLTITRTEEGTSARSIVVGDQIALTITAKVITDIETSSTDPSVILVAAPTGVAATDNAAIAAAITACPTGGVVQLQAGTYAITGLTIAKNLTLRGHGGADITWATVGTLLTLDSATAVGITISAHGVNLENFAIKNTHATAPTAGAGVQVVTGGGISTHYGPNLSIRGFYIDIDHQAGYDWVMDPSVSLTDFVQYGLKIQNVDLADGGDMNVSGYFEAGPNNLSPRACIYWLSGGGLRINSIKTNILGTAAPSVGILVELADGISTSDILIANSSIENSSYGILIQTLAGGSNTGVLDNVCITGNEIAIGLNASPQIGIGVIMAATGQVSEVNVLGNVIRKSSGGGTTVGIKFTKIDNASHGPNVFKSLTSTYVDGGGNTNITAVGNG